MESNTLEGLQWDQPDLQVHEQLQIFREDSGSADSRKCSRTSMLPSASNVRIAADYLFGQVDAAEKGLLCWGFFVFRKESAAEKNCD